MSEENKPRYFWISEACELPPPVPHVDRHADDYIVETKEKPKDYRTNWIQVIELEPVMKMMDEMYEALSKLKCEEIINSLGSGMFNKHDSNCVKCKVLEKYFKFKEGLK